MIKINRVKTKINNLTKIKTEQSLLSTDEECQQNNDQGVNTNEAKEGQQETDEKQEADQVIDGNDQDNGSDPARVEPVYASVLPKNMRPKKQPVVTQHSADKKEVKEN